MCGIWAIFGSETDVTEQYKNSVKIRHRGPDAFRIENVNHFRNCCFGFHHLSIMDDTFGMQPMRVQKLPHLWLCYNGEIYNYKQIGKKFNFDYQTKCDGEAILHLYAYGGVEFMNQQLDGVFALIILDTKERKVILGRDTYGVRPAFKMFTNTGCLAVCSEVKGLHDIYYSGESVPIEPFPPGHYEIYDISSSGLVTFAERSRFHRIGDEPGYDLPSIDSDVCFQENIYELLTAAVRKRLMSQRRMGCFLSGGLDSSLIAALVAKLAKEEGINYPIQTFTIGMEGSPDVAAAKKLADYIGSEHHSVLLKPEDGIAAMEDVIYHLETYDVITIRGSVAMYLLCQYIKENTDSTVIFAGEGADELCGGYINFSKAPTAADADQECRRLLQDIYLYDGLRCDRMVSASGLELRLPFLDHIFTWYYFSIPPEMRHPRGKIEKYLIRSAFEGTNLIPGANLWRPKEGLSDGVSPVDNSWSKVLKNYIEFQVNDDELRDAEKIYPINPPKTKEALYYRKIFERHYPGRANLMPYEWKMKWVDTMDQSGRALIYSP